MARCLAAWTSPTQVFPPYVSLNELPDGTVAFTVRGPGDALASCGVAVTATMPKDAYLAFLTEQLMSLSGPEG